MFLDSQVPIFVILTPVLVPKKPKHEESQPPRHSVPGKLVSCRQHPDTPIAKHHENLLKVGRHAQLRIDVAICL